MIRWLPWLLLVGCYQPDLAPGLPCSPAGECPDGQFCVPGANICVDPNRQSGADGDASPSPDARDLGPDATPASGNDSCTDVFPSPVHNLARCDIPAPGSALVFTAGDWELSTDDLSLNGPEAVPIVALTLTQDSGPELAVIVADSIAIPEGANLRVRGSRPLVLLSATDITVAGTIDGSADLVTPGPGGNVGCGAGVGAPGAIQSVISNVTVDGGSGGGGGGFGASGGSGAIVDQSPGAEPSAGGSSEGTATLSPLRGGCPGGDGARTGGLGGGGGGGLQLTAVGAISVSATGLIDVAGGGGGAAAPTQDFEARGGGGGGSGGAILLQATQLTVAGTLAANGGSGGAGKFYDSSAAGADGSTTASPTAGGVGTNTNGSNGAAGSAGTSLSGGDSVEGTSFVSAPTCTTFCFNILAGGGGGGGGIGRVHLDGTAVDVTGLSSPAPQ